MDDHVAVAFARAAHRAEAVDRRLVQPNTTSPWSRGLVGQVCVSAGEVALIAA
jgi:hypothetical protein